MNGNGLHDLRRVRRRLAELDRRIYANDELIRWTRGGTGGSKPEDREQTIANYMAENEDLEAESDELRYLIAMHERRQDERERARAAWPLSWQVVVVFFAAVVLLLFALAVLRL